MRIRENFGDRKLSILTILMRENFANQEAASRYCKNAKSELYGMLSMLVYNNTTRENPR